MAGMDYRLIVWNLRFLNVDGVETPWNDRNVVMEELGRLSSGK